MKKLLVLITLLIHPLFAISDDVPVLYRGKVHPAIACANGDFLGLPGRNEWFPFEALQQTRNFTLYSDDDFHQIRTAYLALIAGGETAELDRVFSDALIRSYRSIAGKTMRKAHGKALLYPTTGQLFAEKMLLTIPFIEIIVLLYLIRFYPAFALHTGYLLLRCYVLQRPPVSNMYETLIYVPWVISLVAACQKNPLVIRCAKISSILLLSLLTLLTDKLENVQAVLDSQVWLTVHVLMVVGSYGFFILSGVLAHLYFFMPRESITRTLLSLLYIGTGALVIGTLLGGVWAAQSWGRFWDWDPKESWAFISICLYLILIHLYRFKHIEGFGLSIGAILGLQAITFTWYGVNYILGTGLHSYGFGSGGTRYYALFTLAELAFLVLNLSFNRKNDRIEPLKY